MAVSMIWSGWTPRICIVFKLVIFLFLSWPYCDSAPRTSKAMCNITYINPNTTQIVTEAYVGVFGTGLHASERGLITVVKTFNNTDTGCDAYKMSIPTLEWVALMKRGGCTFHNKIQRAKENNASAVVIYNERNASNKFYMVHRVEGIVAVSINYTSGKRIVDLIDQGINITINISVEPRYPKYRKRRTKRKPESPFMVSIVLAMISVSTLIVISLGWLVFLVLQKCR